MQKLIDSEFAEKRSSSDPRLIMVIGPPGSGKTHLGRAWIPEHLNLDKRETIFSDVDVLLSELPEYKEMMAAAVDDSSKVDKIAESRRLRTEIVNPIRHDMIKRAIAGRYNVVVTLVDTGKYFDNVVGLANTAGYKRVFVLIRTNPDKCVSRVVSRADSGAREPIAISTISPAYDNMVRAVGKMFRGRVLVIDNNGKEPSVIYDSETPDPIKIRSLLRSSSKQQRAWKVIGSDEIVETRAIFAIIIIVILVLLFIIFVNYLPRPNLPALTLS